MSGTQSGNEPFAIQVDRWVNKAGARMQAVFDATVQDIVSRLKQLTPVKTGYLRSNWIAVPTGGALPLGNSDSLGFSISDRLLGQSVIIVNPVVYARRINYGFVGKDKLGREYHQAGVHMVEQVVAEAPQIAKAALQRITTGAI